MTADDKVTNMTNINGVNLIDSKMTILVRKTTKLVRWQISSFQCDRLQNDRCQTSKWKITVNYKRHGDRLQNYRFQCQCNG